MSLYERIQYLCKQRHITIAELERESGLTRGIIGHWKDKSPSVDKITKIDDIDIITLQRAKQNMSQKDQEKMMAMLKIAFDYAFQDDNKGVD